MTVAGKSEFTKLVEQYKCIYPFTHTLLDGDGYVLTVKDEVTLNYLEHRNMISNEVVFTPPNYVAHLTAKSRYGRLGLSFLNAAKVHSGFIGRLALELVNLSNERTQITIKRGNPLIHIEFLSRKGDPSPYEGEFQFQYMDEHEVGMYMDMINREFGNLFDRNKLEDIAKKRVHMI
ncbi:MAG: hypothetical protein ACE5KA_01755 [Nitrososphaerales archaeon]